MTKWEQIKINRGVSYGGYEDEEERKYKQQVEQNKAALEQYKQYVKQVEMREGAAQRNYERSQELSPTQIQGVVEGKNTPLELKSAEQRLNNIEPKYRGLLYAAAQSDTGGLRGLANKTRLMETMGMDEDNVARLYEDTQMLQKYGQAVRDGNGASYLSKEQKGVYAEMKHDELPDDLKAAMDDYREKYTKELWRRDKLGNVIGAIAPDNTDLEAFNYSRKYGISVEDAQKYLKREQWLAEKEFQKIRDEKSTIDDDASSFEKFRMGVSNTAKAVANTIPGGFMALAGRYNERNSELGYNTDSYFNAGLNEAQHAQQEVSKNIDNKYLNFAYNTGVSTLQAAATIGTAALTGGGELFTLGTFAANSYATTYNEAKEKGLSDANADKLGITSAVVETFTEWASLEHAYNIYRTNKAGGVNLLVDMLAQGGVEMSEEAASELLNDFAENQLIGYTGMSQRDLVIKNAMDNGATREEAEKEATKDFVRREIEAGLGGFFSGLAMGGGANVISNYKAGKARKESSEMYQSEVEENEGLTREDRVAKEQAEIYAKNPVRAQVDMMHDQSDLGKERKAKAMKIAEAYEKKGKLNAKENFELQNLLEEDFTSNEYTDYKHYAEDIQGNVTNGLSEDEFSRGMVKAIKNGDIDSVADLYDKATHSSSAALRQSANEIYDSYKNMAEANGISSEQFEAVKMSTEEAYKAGYNNVEMENLTSIQKESYNEGVKARIEERSAEVQNEIKGFDETTSKVFQANMNNALSVKQNGEAFNVIMKQAQSGLSLESMLKNPSAIALGEDNVKNIRNFGIAQYNSALSNERTKILREQKYIKKGAGKFNDKRTNFDKDIDTRMFSTMAKAFSLNINLIDDNGSGNLASFDPSTSTITITSSHVGQIFHELGEVAEFYNLKGYDRLRKAALEFVKDDIGEKAFSSMLDNYQKAYLEDNKSQTIYDSSTEMANDIIAAVMSREESQKKFAQMLVDKYGVVEGKSLGQKIQKLFSKMLDSIKSLFANSNMSDFQKRVFNSKMAEADKLASQFMNVLDEAINNYNNTVFNENAVNMGDATVRASIQTYNDGGRAAIEIYINDEIKNGNITEEQGKDILDELDWGYKIATELAAKKELVSFGNWSKTGLSVAADGTPYLEMFTPDGRPIKSVVVNNGEYPLNIDFTQVCKKRVALNTVLNKLVADADLNLNVLTESDINDINRLIKEHGFEIACGLCFVDSKRYRVGEWANTFAEGKFDKNGRKYQGGWNDIIKSILPKGVNADYFNFASNNEAPLGTLLSDLTDDQINWTKIDAALKPYLKEDGTLGAKKTASGKASNPTERIKMMYLIRNNPSVRHFLDKNDIIASDGLDAMREQNYDLYKLVNAHWGAGKPKLPHGYTAYGNDIIKSATWSGKKNNFSPENSWKVGGVRVQSFSDFVANMFFDYMQMFADMSARQLPSHAYTKEVDYVRMFGLTGQKINMSLVPRAALLTPEQQARYEKLGKRGVKAILNDPEFKALAEHAGLDAKGNYIWEDETFPFKEAMKLRSQEGYKDNCGTIAVGVSNAHIRKLLADPNIDMVIPYHSSGVSQLIKKARNIALYTDYQNVQNTRNEKGDAMKNDGFDWYGQLKSENNPNGLEAKEVAANYLKYCEEKGYTPKFDEFKDDPNYYKLLTDFRMYDENGNFQQQNAVRANYPKNLKQIALKALQAQQLTEDKMDVELSEEQNSLYTEVKNILAEKGTLTVPETRMSKEVDSDGDSLTEGQSEYFKNSKVRDKDGKLIPMYHGTGNVFYEFDKNRIGSTGAFEGSGFNFTPSESRAAGYNNGVIMKGYLNITNPLSNNKITFSARQLADIIAKVDPTGDDIIANYARDTRDYGTPVFIRREALVTAREIINYSESDVDVYSSLSSAGGRAELMDAFKELGYDGLIHYYDNGDIQTGVAFDSNQFKNIDNQNPTNSPDIRYSIQIDEESGIEYVEVDTDQKRLEGLDEQALLKEVRTILKEFIKSNNRLLGNIDDTDITGNHDLVSHYAGAARKQYKKDSRAEAKFRATPELLNLIKVSQFDNHATYEDIQANTPGKHLEAEYGITQYKTLFHVLDNYYVGYLNVLNRKQDRVLYDITKIRKIAKGDIAATMSRVAVANPSYNQMLTYYKNKGNKYSESNIDIRKSKSIDSISDEEFIDDLLDDIDLDFEEMRVLNDWKDVGINKLLNELKSKIDEAPKAKRQNTVKHLTRKMLGDTFNNIDGKRASFTNERIEQYLDAYAASSPNYSKAYITYMSPADFILLTANQVDGDRLFKNLMSQSRAIDTEALGNSLETAGQAIHLDVIKVGKKMQVVEHQGRHRMIGFQLAGFNKIPVLITEFDEGTKYNKQHIDELTLIPQDWSKTTSAPDPKYNKSNYVTVKDVDVLSTGNREMLYEKYGDGSGADIRFSKEVDTDGRELTDNQKEFFKDSKARDEDGALMVLYHGSTEPGFSIFNTDTIFLSDNPYVANTYTYNEGYTPRIYDGEKGDIYKVYANLENPLIVDATRDLSGKYDAEISYAENIDKYTLSLSNGDTKRFEVGYGREFLEQYYDPKTVDRIEKHFESKKSSYKIKNRNTTVIKPTVYTDIEFNGKKYSADELATYAKENGYDGVIIKNVVDDQSFSEKGRAATDVIVFKSSQLKNVDNQNPTTNPDIRYSKEVRTPLDWAADFVDLAMDFDDYNTLDYIDYDYQSEVDGIVADIDMGKTEFYKNTLEGIIFDDDFDQEMRDKAERLLNELNRQTGNRYAKDLDDVIFDILDNQDNPTVDESILAKGMEALKGKPVDTRAINKIVAEIKNETGSKINNKELSDMLSRAFAYLHSQNNVRFNDVISMFEEVAKPIVDNSTHLDNVELYKDFTEYFKDTKIRLSETQMDEVKAQYGSYKDFQKAMYPLQFSVKGNSTLDSMWTSLAEAYPGLIEYGINEGDMPATLNDVLNAIKPKPQNNFGANAEEYGKDLAMEIIQKYFESQTDAKVKKAAENLKSSEKEYREKVRKRYQERYAEAKKKLAETYTNKLEYEKKRAQLANDWDIADIKAKSKNLQMKLKDRKEAAHQKKMIGKTVKELYTRIEKPTENKHVPSQMVKPLMEFLQCLDFVEPEVKYDKKNKVYYITDFSNKTPSGYGRFEGATSTEALQKYYDGLNEGKGSRNQKRWQERATNLQKLFNANFDNEDGISDVINMLDSTLADSLQDVIDRNDNVVNINSLNTDDLIVVKNALRNILSAINKQNKAFTMKAEISETAHDIMSNGSKMKVEAHSKLYNDLHKTLAIDMMTPETYFTLLGNRGRDLYGSFQKAFEDKILKIKHTSEFMENLFKDIDMRDWTGRKAEVYTFDVSEGTIQMTPAQIMSLYELSKRNQAALHFAGGIEVEKVKVNGKEVYQNKGIHLSASEMQMIFDKLTDEQKRIADSMQKYMAEVCGGWGNEASMLMYDFEKFLDPNYFPITTDSDTNPSKNEEALKGKMLNGIERMGFTKAVNENASNPIVIKDIFDVFVKHTVDMASYSAYAPTIKDALRVYNYKEIIAGQDTFKDYIPVKKALNACLGRSDSAGKMYFEQFIRDVNGLERANEMQTAIDALTGNFKAAAVGGNIRVVVQQPTAYIRAGMVINPKYLVEAIPSMALSSKKMDELKNKNPLIYWKSQGYYETNIGRSEKSIITGMDTIPEKITEASMWLAGKADDITWSCLYNAAEKQVRAENPGLSGDEFKAKVDKLFNDAITETQVVDATIMKSPWQRNSSKYSKFVTSFMAEPIKSYNIGMKALIQAKRGEIPVKAAAYAAGVLLATDMVNSLVQALIDGVRYHDDDDDEYYEQLLNYWMKNFVDNVNPIKRIPILKDGYDMLVEGIMGESNYGTTRGQTYEYSVMQTVADALSTVRKQMAGEYNKTGYSAYMTYARAFSQLTGIPVYNFSRDAVSFWNFFVDDNLKVKKQIEKPTDKYNVVISALDKERSDEYLNDAVQDVMEKDGTLKKLESKIVSEYKQDYLEALENDDKISDEIFDNAVRGYMAMGLSRSDAEAEVESWADVKVGYSDMDKAIESGDGIDLATKIVIENKETDKILKHIYDSYGATIEFNRAKGYSSNIEANVNKALKQVADMDYDGMVDYFEAKEAEKQAKAEATAQRKTENDAKAQIKKNITDTVTYGTDYKKAVSDAVNSGMDYSDIKAALTSEYKDQVIAAYKAGNKSSVSTTVNRIITIKAYCDKESGLKIAKKYNGNYEAYERDHLQEWFE